MPCVTFSLPICLYVVFIIAVPSWQGLSWEIIQFLWDFYLVKLRKEKKRKRKVVPAVYQCYIKHCTFITYFGFAQAQMHFRCFQDFGVHYFQLCQTVVLNNYEQVGWVLNLGAQRVQSSTVMPTPGPQGKKRKEAIKGGHRLRGKVSRFKNIKSPLWNWWWNQHAIYDVYTKYKDAK